jgi:hypothetical protein
MTWMEPFGVGLGVGSATGGTTVVGPQLRGSPTTGVLTATGAVPLPATLSGDWVLVVIAASLTLSRTGPTTPSGWTQTATQESSSTDSQIWAYTIQASGPGTTFTSPQSVSRGVYNAYVIQSSAGVDVSGTATNNTTTISSPAVDATGSNDLVISCFGGYAGGLTVTIGTPSAGTPTAQQTNTSTDSIALVTSYQKLNVSGETTAVTASLTGTTQEWDSITVAFK